MKPIYLHINNFTCHEESEIDFRKFRSALIIGRQDNNERISNGLGKTSIFKAIEYALFNQVRVPLQEKDILLEDLILEGANRCQVIFDFESDGEIFRIIRRRTIKNISDLSFYRRTPIVDGRDCHTSITDTDLWLDVSSRRTQDTEEDIAKVIKTHHKAFINTAYFMQFDFKNGLAAATPANRKAILREALDLLVYAKLEKLAKNNADKLIKEIEKQQIILSNIGDPQKDIEKIKKEASANEAEINIQLNNQEKISEKLINIQKEHQEFIIQLSTLEAQSSSVRIRQNSLQEDIKKIKQSINDYNNKKQNVEKEIVEIHKKNIKFFEIKSKYENNDFNQIDQLKEKNRNNDMRKASITTEQNSLQEKLEVLKIPLPIDGICKHCRQPLSVEHRASCLIRINEEIKETEQKIKHLDFEYKEIFNEQLNLKKKLDQLEKNNSNLLHTNNEIDKNNRQIKNGISVQEEYVQIITKYNKEIEHKQQELELVNQEINTSYGNKLEDFRLKVQNSENELYNINRNYKLIENNINQLKTKQAVCQHSLQEKENLIKRKIEISNIIEKLTNEYADYPMVIQGFGPTGIPSLVINNILEDLQNEANTLLSQLRPGLQLLFKIEKTKTDGTKDDTLDIEYFLNGKPRKYTMLSGAQQVFIMFSLKLGLSFLLKKMLGAQINLLLIDEVDQPFDEEGVDAFAEIIKSFQREFTILVITHRAALKEYFRDIIVVDQNRETATSKAKVISV